MSNLLSTLTDSSQSTDYSDLEATDRSNNSRRSHESQRSRRSRPDRDAKTTKFADGKCTAQNVVTLLSLWIVCNVCPRLVQFMSSKYQEE